jgi:ACS family tartrate transporter-like MFS transporter
VDQLGTPSADGRFEWNTCGLPWEKTMTELIEKAAMRKIYIRLLPFAILSYFLAYIDRINVSFAALTMRDDLGISASAYGFALGTFTGAISYSRCPAT